MGVKVTVPEIPENLRRLYKQGIGTAISRRARHGYEYERPHKTVSRRIFLHDLNRLRMCKRGRQEILADIIHLTMTKAKFSLAAEMVAFFALDGDLAAFPTRMVEYVGRVPAASVSYPLQQMKVTFVREYTQPVVCFTPGSAPAFASKDVGFYFMGHCRYEEGPRNSELRVDHLEWDFTLGHVILAYRALLFNTPDHAAWFLKSLSERNENLHACVMTELEYLCQDGPARLDNDQNSDWPYGSALPSWQRLVGRY